MTRLGLIAISCFCIAAGEAPAVSPAIPDQCVVLDLNSAELPEMARLFLINEGGGLLRLCSNKQYPNVTVHHYASDVEKLENGICRYFISQVYEVHSPEGQRLSYTRESPRETSKRYYYQDLRDGEECSAPGNRMREPSNTTYVLEDLAYIQVDQMEDAIFIAFLSYWRHLTTSPERFESMLPEKSVLRVRQRHDEGLWLINGCLSAEPQGCRIVLRRLQVGQWAHTMVRASFRIIGFDQIDGVNSGRARYSAQQKRYEGIVNFWQSEKGYEPAH